MKLQRTEMAAGVLAADLTKEDVGDAGSLLVFGIGLLLCVIYLLTKIEVIKTGIPVRIIAVFSSLLYILLSAVTVSIYVSDGSPVSSYYGILGSVFGMTFFYAAMMLSSFSIGGKKHNAEPDEPEQAEEMPAEV